MQEWHTCYYTLDYLGIIGYNKFIISYRKEVQYGGKGIARPY